MRLTTRIRKARRRRKHLRTSYDAVSFDGSPVSPVLALVLGQLRSKYGLDFGVISGDRRDGIAQKFGKSSQAQCYYGHLNGDPAYPYPANPPNSSTHEYVNGGNGGTPAFPRMAVGARLAPHQLGLDLRSNDEASAFCREAGRRGVRFFQPYPSGTELHHVCCRMKMRHLIQWLVREGVIR